MARDRIPAVPAARHLRLGRWGEQLAVRIYRRDGYRILARNWRGRCGEVDVIAVGSHEVVFCEVKARSSVRHGSPLEAVDRRRRDRLRRAAAEWLAGPGRSHGDGMAVRFDVVGILPGRIERVEGAF